MTYNGWKNWETWNVALWFGNDEGLYRMAALSDDYEEFRNRLRFEGVEETPDGASYWAESLDIESLNEAIEETA